MGEGEERGFFFGGGDFGFLFWLRLDGYGEGRLTDFLVGVGKPQHICEW
jgi:hypothetical protein